MPEHSPYYILGAGSIGLLWANYFSMCGDKPVLLTKYASQPALHRITLTVDDITHQNPIEILDAASIKFPINSLIVTTKAYDVKQAITELQSKIASDATIIFTQNGIGIWREIKALLPSQTIYAASITHGAYKTEEFHAVHSGIGQCTVGLIQGESKAADAILKELPKELNCIWSNNIQHIRWQKVAVNAVINPLTALINCNNGFLIHHDETLSIMKELCNEIAPVLSLLKLNDSANDLLQHAKLVAEKTALNFSSMQQDIQFKGKTEIDYITGQIIAVARKHGLRMATNEYLYRLIKLKEYTMLSRLTACS